MSFEMRSVSFAVKLVSFMVNRGGRSCAVKVAA
ncbi:hypothetical protein A2U01_0116657, partial [Trifolium medium]|nr:hypothetical protein [Trifolium medium]